jgi:hypothetical protein
LLECALHRDLLPQALAELKLWGMQRELSFSSGATVVEGGGAKTSGAAAVPLIREWRDVLSEVILNHNWMSMPGGWRA